MVTLPLNNRIKISIPGSGIENQGRLEVLNYIRACLPGQYIHLPMDDGEEWSWEWVVKIGSYQGTLPKRIQKFLFNTQKHKLTPEQISELGNIAQRWLPKTDEWEIDFVKEFDWEAGDFGDSGSCFWGDRRETKWWLKEVGAYALRRLRPNTRELGYGRCWILTHESVPDGFVVFNGYGKYDSKEVNHKYGSPQTRDFARVLLAYLKEHHTDLHYEFKPVQFSINGSTSSPVWINNDGNSAALCAPRAVLTEIPKNLNWSYSVSTTQNCDSCGDSVYRSELRESHGIMVCESCYESGQWGRCDICGAERPRITDNIYSVERLAGELPGLSLCIRHYRATVHNRDNTGLTWVRCRGPYGRTPCVSIIQVPATRNVGTFICCPNH